MIEKITQIQDRFNKASKSYDYVACVQKDAAEFLVKKLLQHQYDIPKTILDLGTGTGYIPQLLLEKFPTSSFYLNDIASKMLDSCKTKFSKAKNVYYLPGDMLKLDTDIYDCVISNFALQWSADLEYAINFLYNKSSNIFAFSTLLDGTFEEWENIIQGYQSTQILDYPKAEHIIDLCHKIKKNNQGFEFWLIDHSLSFENPLSFMRYLKSLGASAPCNLVDLSNIKKLIKIQHQPFTVTYKIFFGIFSRVTQ